jgi:stage II sporulation protein R
MKKTKNAFKILTTFILGILIFLFIWSIIPTREECEIYNSTIRLHVLANSDSEKDQNAKLKVRDSVLEHISTYKSESKEQTLALIMADKEKLEKIAEETLKKEGILENVTLEIGKEDYPTRNYASFSLPAGEYTSVRVVIGEGEGQNWWCVLFPPICTAEAIEYDEETYIDVGLTKDQYFMITGTSPEYEIKFKLLEIVSEAFGTR